MSEPVVYVTAGMYDTNLTPPGSECAPTRRRYGARIFYLGHGVNTARECVFHGVFFATFEHLNHGKARGSTSRI
jgi:hypothetical protein